MISEDVVPRVREEALEAWRKLDFPEYFKIMEQACRQVPTNVELLMDMGAAYGMRYDYASAERCFEKAIRVSPRREDVLIMAGTHCRGFNRYEMARHYFERAVGEPGASSDTYVKLAEMYERFRLVDEACGLVDRALRLDPACALASLVRARLDRLSGRLEEAEGRLRPLLSKSSRDTWSTRIRGWYELGAVLDAQGRYDEAMAAFLKAKAMILPHAGPCIATQKLVHSQLKIANEKLNAETVARWRTQGAAPGLPWRLAGLCGHPRSGTTLLEQVLDAHPDFISAEETMVFQLETVGFLSRELPSEGLLLEALESASPGVLRQARQNYAECMTRFLGHPPDGRMLIDKNPSLTGLVPAFVRVFPEAKLLVALRDPRDVCLSCFMQPLPLGRASSIFLTLEGTVEGYASHMGLWRAVAPCLGDCFLEVRYEDLIADLEGGARRVLDFLGAGWDDRVLRFNEFAARKMVRSPSYAAVAKPISRGAVGRWRNYQKHLEPWLDTLAPLVKAFGYE
jgi:tetratricopeptide (TPR) repeat protein